MDDAVGNTEGVENGLGDKESAPRVADSRGPLRSKRDILLPIEGFMRYSFLPSAMPELTATSCTPSHVSPAASIHDRISSRV